MLETVQSCGATGYVVPLVALVAFVAAVVGAALAFAGKRRTASIVAGLALFLAGATALTGFTGTLLGRAQVARAIDLPSIGKAERERLLHQGGLEARGCSRLGVGAAALPFFIGCVGAVVALFAKGKEGGSGDGGPVVPVVLLGAATAFTGLLGSGGLAAARVAGADYEPLVWNVMARSERVTVAPAEEVSAACEALEDTLAGPSAEGERACGARIDLDLAAASDLPKATEICVRDRVALIGKSSPDDRKPLARATRCSATFGVLPASPKSVLEPQLHAFE